MKAGKASRTARYMALFRALESNRSEEGYEFYRVATAVHT
jgi:hypothetical protein